MAPEKEFNYEPKFAKLEISWYDEWLQYTKGEKILPEPLNPQEEWDHPYMKQGYTAAMHEGPRASDVSNNPGPTLKNPRVQYFHVKQKGGDFSGMCPTFAFINDSRVATLSFGRANTTLLLLDVKDTIQVLDHLPIPGRGSTAFELAGKKGAKRFSATPLAGPIRIFRIKIESISLVPITTFFALLSKTGNSYTKLNRLILSPKLKQGIWLSRNCQKKIN
jgi:hypothetical protein